MKFWFLFIFLKIHIVARGKIRHTSNAKFLNIQSINHNHMHKLNHIRFTNSLRFNITSQLKKVYIKNMIELKYYEEIYLLISLKITSLEEESTPGKYSCKIHRYLFITNFILVQNGFILIYQDILNNLNCDPPCTYIPNWLCQE